MSEPKSKSFAISKRVVFEAYRRVKANKGAAGVDDESVAAFEVDLKDNLYKLWNRMSSGSYVPPPVKMVQIPKPGARGSGFSACRLSRTGSRRPWRPCIWSRGWNRCSIRTPTGTGRAGRRWTRWRRAGSAAGEPIG
ncbi:hypothetical protein GCM10027610_081280 [Dactylosporangium cerinum]